MVRDGLQLPDRGGVPLRERLPVYERFLPGDGEDGNEWVSERVVAAIRGDGAAGERYRSVLAD